jgi:hypothetical protein
MNKSDSKNTSDDEYNSILEKEDPNKQRNLIKEKIMNK